MNDAAIDDALARRSSEPVEDVYRRLGRDLVVMGTLLTGSRQSGEELVHDVFTAAIPRWDSIAEPEHYLRRAIVNRARSQRRRIVTASGWRPEPAIALGEPEMDETWRLLRRLPSNQRIAVVLRTHLDLSDREIATYLGCSKATVRSLVFRALTRLRKDLT